MPRIISDFFIAFTLSNPLSYLLSLSFPWPIPRIPHPFPYIEPRESQMNFLIKWFDI